MKFHGMSLRQKDVLLSCHDFFSFTPSASATQLDSLGKTVNIHCLLEGNQNEASRLISDLQPKVPECALKAAVLCINMALPVL